MMWRHLFAVMWFLWSLLAALVAASAAAIEEDVLLRAEAAASACTAPGGAPHPWDPQLLVLCADANVPLTVVHCPPGTRASNATKGCQLTENDGYEAAAAAAAPHRRRLRREGPSDVDRICKDGAGIYCDGCDNMVVCSVVDKKMRILNNDSCSSHGDLACDSTTRSCTAGSTCSSGTGSGFRCLVPGIYPDPEDCKRYHVCDDDLQDFTDTCDVEYDAEKEECVNDKKCTATAPPKKCSSTDSATKAFSEMSPFYRICLLRSPKGYTTSVMRCPQDQTFDSTKGACTYKCTGTIKRYADPANCHNYYDCTGTDAKLELKSCSKGLAFDSKKAMCLQEAKVQECALPTTSTSTTTTTTTSTTTPAPALPQIPPTAAPTTSTAAPTRAPSPGDCTREGTMADPSSTSRYFVCTRSGDKYIKRVESCPALTTFDRSKEYCVAAFWSSFPFFG